MSHGCARSDGSLLTPCCGQLFSAIESVVATMPPDPAAQVTRLEQMPSAMTTAYYILIQNGPMCMPPDRAAQVAGRNWADESAAAFDAIDVDGNGLLDYEEVRVASVEQAGGRRLSLSSKLLLRRPPAVPLPDWCAVFFLWRGSSSRCSRGCGSHRARSRRSHKRGPRRAESTAYNARAPRVERGGAYGGARMQRRGSDGFCTSLRDPSSLKP